MGGGGQVPPKCTGKSPKMHYGGGGTLVVEFGKKLQQNLGFIV